MLFLNSDPSQKVVSDEKDFTLKIPPKTDIFVSLTTGYYFSSPIAYKIIPIHRFKKARATITIPYTLESNPETINENPTLQFDQAGLVFVLPHPKHKSPSLVDPGSGGVERPHPRWIKAGVEVWEGKALGSIVARENWSDWSLFEVSCSPGIPEVTVTIEMERLENSLMIYKIDSEKRILVRKVPWCFIDGETQETVWVGAYGARPDPYDEAKGRTLEATLKDFDTSYNEEQASL